MNVRIIMIASSGVVGELVNAIAYSIRELGHKCVIVGENNIGPKHCDVNIVVKAFRFFELASISGVKVLFQTEDMWKRLTAGNPFYGVYDVGEGYDRCLDYTHENTLVRSGAEKACHCPYGYSPALETNLIDLEWKDRDIDIYFYGSKTTRRKEFARDFNKINNGKFNFRFVTEEYGEVRDKNIMRSKIVINLKAHEVWTYGALHLLLAQCKRRFVMCEPGVGGYKPYTNGSHAVEFKTPQELFDKASEWISKPKELRQRELDVYDDLKANYKFTKYIKSALSGII